MIFCVKLAQQISGTCQNWCNLLVYMFDMAMPDILTLYQYRQSRCCTNKQIMFSNMPLFLSLSKYCHRSVQIFTRSLQFKITKKNYINCLLSLKSRSRLFPLHPLGTPSRSTYSCSYRHGIQALLSNYTRHNRCYLEQEISSRL